MYSAKNALLEAMTRTFSPEEQEAVLLESEESELKKEMIFTYRF